MLSTKRRWTQKEVFSKLYSEANLQRLQQMVTHGIIDLEHWALVVKIPLMSPISPMSPLLRTLHPHNAQQASIRAKQEI